MIIKKQHVVFISLLFWLMGSPCRAAFETLPPNIIHKHQNNVEVKYAAWLEDSDNALDESNVSSQFHRFKIEESGNLSFGISHSDFWIAVKVILQEDQSIDKVQRYLLEVKFPLLAIAQIYQFHNSRVIPDIDLGYDNPINNRIIKHQNPLFPIELKNNQEYLLLMKVAAPGGSVQAPMRIWENDAFIESDSLLNYLLGGFFGTLFAMVVYNGFLYVNLRISTYFFYVTYISLSALAYLALNGQGFLYLWPDTPSFNGISAPFLCVLTTISGLLFFKSFIRISGRNPRIQNYTNMLLAIGLAISIAIYASHQLLGIYAVIYISIVSISVIVLSFYLWRNGSRQAGFFLLAWLLFVIGVLCFLAVLLGLLPNNLLTRHSLQLGSMTEAFLLSFALADSINQAKKEKYQALQKEHIATKQLKKAEAQLDYRALHSRTTGLPNRTLLRQRLSQLINANIIDELYLILVSLDNFHEINKTLGHRTGDVILKKLTSRMNGLIKGYDNHIELEEKADAYDLAHIEGVIFAFVLRQGQNPIFDQAESFLRSFDMPVVHQDLSLDIEARIGIAKYPDHGPDPDQLLKNSHIALEFALSKNEKIAFYAPEENLYNEQRLTRISELKLAIQTNRLALYFQPQLDLRSESIKSAEALIRWQHPERGFIPPDHFIPLAERTGLIHPLTYYVCDQGFSFLKKILPSNRDFRLSVNISAKNLQDKLFRSKILELLKKHQVPPANIVLELTETAVMTNPEDALEMIGQLSQTGIDLSIDDFGTGYSSLAYLKRLPVKELKIDRTFVMDMNKNNDDQIIVETTLRMAQNLGLSVVAEGIENDETLIHLKNLGCDTAQGYHIARPMPEDAFLLWLNNSDEAKKYK
ncbi:MAG: EAL domain-containing protein [Pseudomonadales bacterium]|nr:EAL domain-containing protein [Pseudomonadales bacterium]